MAAAFPAWARYISLKLSLIGALHLMLQATTRNDHSAL